MSRIADAQMFVAVVEAGGFTAAALELGLSQSAVSRRITALEERLGVRLLVRSTRALRPTNAGSSYYERCHRALAELEEAECEAAAQGAEPRGALRLTAPPAFGRTVLLPQIAAFTAAHPAISVDLLLSERRLDLAEEGVDLAVRIDDPGRPLGLIRTRLTHFDLIACAAPAYLASRGTPRRPADLANHACLIQIAHPSSRDRWQFQPRAPGSRAGRRQAEPGTGDVAAVQVAGPLRSNDVEALAIAARAHAGVALLPDFLVAADLKRGSLQRVLPRYAARRVEVFAVYAERRHLPARVRALLDFFIARLRRR